MSQMPIGMAARGGGGTLKGFLGRGMSSSPLDLFKTDIAYFATLLK